jgi:hypothetical protein
MTPLERLLQEAIPTRPAPAVHRQWTKEEQDEHWDELARAIGCSSVERPQQITGSEAAA